MIEAVFASMMANDTMTLPARGIADLVGTDSNGNVRVFLKYSPYSLDEIDGDPTWAAAIYDVVDETTQYRSTPDDMQIQIAFWAKDPVLIRKLAARARILFHEQEAEMNTHLTDRRIDACTEQRRIPHEDAGLQVPGMVVQYRVLSYELD